MKKIVILSISIILIIVVSVALTMSFVACDNKGTEGNGNTEPTISKITEYSLIYHLNGGRAENPLSYNSETDTFTLVNPTKEGFIFEGWTTATATTPLLEVVITKGSSGDKEFWANYTLAPDPDTFNITYNLDGGEVTGNRTTYRPTTSTFTLKNPTKLGYEFLGWTYEGQTTPTLTVTISKGSRGSKEFTANYKLATYTITYTLGGGTVEGNPTTYTYETPTFTLANPEKIGYEFLGWTVGGSTLANPSFEIVQGSTGDKNMVAVYRRTQYTLTYVLDGGTATNPASYNVETATFTLANPVKVGYDFLGWTYEGQTEPLLAVTLQKGSIGNKTYTANYQEIAIPQGSYRISYTLNGGLEGDTNNPIYYTAETPAFTLSNPTKRGYEFSGWTYEGQTTPQLEVTIETGSTGDKTFVANYTIENYTITYVLDGGEAEGNPLTYTILTPTFTLNSPEKAEYIFVGWTDETHAELSENYTIEIGSVGDLVITANYILTPPPFSAVKVAVFADVQLCVNNLGATANAYLALVKQLQYAKSQNVDVLMLTGDICNNAVEDYYLRFENALKTVYGTDESKYPEFVWIMGNHEWWDTAEHDTANAVSLFNKYARIDTENLVARSTIKYKMDNNATLPNYYKVVNGIPFLAISAYDSSGKITAAQRTEIESWLEDISELDSVKAGGAIYVAYHYAIANTTYFGQGASSNTDTFDDIFKNYPNVIVFTGDTHYPGTNERTINQKNYTSINIGSSSYSRMINHSATTATIYENTNKNAGKTGDKVIGEVSYLYEYTSIIHIIDCDDDANTTINRYVTNDIANVRHVGLEWNIPAGITKATFTYTDNRFQNTDWATLMYGATGLSWGEEAEVKFNVEGSNMMVYFPDVIDYNYAEHYKITVIPDGNESNTKSYDFVGNYYKWENFSHNYHCLLENVPTATCYTVKVVAYDYFDNPSLTALTSTTDDDRVGFVDVIDKKMNDSYCDISKNINYEVKTEGSNSSNEYYYKGIYNYKNGAILFRAVMADTSTVAVNNSFSVTDWSDAILTLKVKNPNNFFIYAGLTVVVANGSGGEKWLTDFGSEYRKEIPANSDWTEVRWSLKKEFGIDSYSDIKQLCVKASATTQVMNCGDTGWEMHFYIDDFDIVNNEGEEEDLHEFAFGNTAGADLTKSNIFTATREDTLSFEYKLVTPASQGTSKISLMIFNLNDWHNYIGYFSIDTVNNTCSASGITITEGKNGWYKVDIKLEDAHVEGSEDVIDGYTLNAMYIRGAYTTSSVLLDNFIVK